MNKRRVYIAGPITKGDLAENVNQATKAFVELAKAGYAPLCPHWSVYSSPCHSFNVGTLKACVVLGTVNGNEEMSHNDWVGLDLPWVECADAVVRLPGESKGADAEVHHAMTHGIPVFDSVAQLIETDKVVGEILQKS